MSKEIIYKIAKELQESMGAISYGKIRSKITKQGFSEISLYSAVARHCEENDIKPSSIVEDMETLLKGCCENAFYPKTDNKFHYLRGQYYDLRNGNLDADESKSPEQRGLFLCNRCFLVKTEKERCKNRNEKNSCQECKDVKTRQYYAERTKQKKAEKADKEASKPQQAFELVEQPVIEPVEENFNVDPQTPPEPIAETQVAVSEEIEVMPEETKPAKQKQKTFAHLLGGSIEPDRTGVKITEVIGDENGATVTVACSVATLHLVLSALSHVTES